MKTLELITYIICHVMTDDDFDQINGFDQWDRDDDDKRVAYNGLRRLRRHLAKYNLTVEEWDLFRAT